MFLEIRDDVSEAAAVQIRQCGEAALPQPHYL